MTTAALVLAAGRGERLGADVPKAFVSLRGESLLVRSLRVLSLAPGVERVVPVVAIDDFDRCRELAALGLPNLVDPVAGGAERQDSVAAGLASLPETTRFVAVHDAARCLVSKRDLAAVLASGQRDGAAILAEPTRDTIKRVRDGRIVETPDRSECWAAQTPQVFAVEILREALTKARAEGRVGSDDAQLVESLGVTVRVVESQDPNPKITKPEDLVWAESWLAGKDG